MHGRCDRILKHEFEQKFLNHRRLTFNIMLHYVIHFLMCCILCIIVCTVYYDCEQNTPNIIQIRILHNTVLRDNK